MPEPLVLCYHGISDEWEQPLAVCPAAFERQLESLLARRFRPVGPEEAVDGRGRLLHVTFDDAYKNVANAVPILERLGVPATVFVAAGFADEGRPLDVPELAQEAADHPGHLATMDWDELRALAERGFEIGSHTVNHQHLPRLSDAELDRELRESRARCEEELGRPCRYLAYPYGEHDERVRAAARRAGYRAAFALDADLRKEDRYALPRVHFYRRDSLARATLKTSFGRRRAYALAARLRRDPGRAPEGAHEGGWLAPVLPTDAQRVRVADWRVATTLAEAGLELVEQAPEVEIAPVAALRGDARLGVAYLVAPPHDSRSLAVRAARRLGNSLWLRVRAAHAARAVRRRGYPHVDVILWDFGQRFPLSGSPRPRKQLVERLPLRALVIGRSSATGPTVLDAAIADATRAAGTELGTALPSIRAGGVVTMMTDAFVLQLAVGPARRQVRAQLAVREALRAAGAGPIITDRIPWAIASGRSSLAEWSLQPRLPGSMPGPRLDDALLAQCVDFLVALHALRNGEQARSLTACAEVVAAYRPAEPAAALLALAARLDGALAGVPRGFGHGDFFLGNLLVEDGRLVGVVDWDAGGHGRLPLVDLMHLRHMAEHRVPDEDWGDSLVTYLLPWARAGGDDVARGYCRRIGLEPDTATLEALVLAYWLDRLAYQVETHVHRRAQGPWLVRNVDHVLRVAGDERTE